MIDARTGDYAPLVERIRSKLDEIGANDFEVEGPECPFGDGHLWIGMYSIGGQTQQRWAAYVSSRRQTYHQAPLRVSEERDLLALAGPMVLMPQIEECRTRLLASADAHFTAVLEGMRSGNWPTEVEWILDVPATADRQVIWLWAATRLVSGHS